MTNKIEILGRVNDEKTKECIRFLVNVADEDNNTLYFTVHYERLAENTWRAYCMPILNTSNNRARIYSEIYMMPKKNMPLEKVASFGLTNIRSSMMEDIMNLNAFTYELSQMIKE